MSHLGEANLSNFAMLPAFGCPKVVTNVQGQLFSLHDVGFVVQNDAGRLLPF